MRIVMADLPGSGLSNATEDVRRSGAEVLAVPTDVRNQDEVVTLAAQTAARFGGTDILCNNAGVQAPGVAWELSLEDWRWVLDVNLWGQIHGIRAFLPGMVKRGQPGHVVSTASMAGHLAYLNRGPYTVSKFGVVGLSEMLVQDLKNAGAPIGVSVLCPGLVETNLYRNSTQLRPSGAQVGAPAAAGPKGMPADSVADMVLTAIRSNQFWILTHPEYAPLIEKRAHGIAVTGEVVPGV